MKPELSLRQAISSTSIDSALLVRFERHYAMKRVSARAIADCSKHLEGLLTYLHARSLRISTLAIGDLTEHIIDLEYQGVPTPLINIKLLVYGLFFQYLYENGYIATNPAAALRLLDAESGPNFIREVVYVQD
ncbi:MAG: hypothetical protein IPH75_05320 [bacterium]|nr:hypothetical protein [bacterium]